MADTYVVQQTKINGNLLVISGTVNGTAIVCQIDTTSLASPTVLVVQSAIQIAMLAEYNRITQVSNIIALVPQTFTI